MVSLKPPTGIHWNDQKSSLWQSHRSWLHHYLMAEVNGLRCVRSELCSSQFLLIASIICSFGDFGVCLRHSTGSSVWERIGGFQFGARRDTGPFWYRTHGTNMHEQSEFLSPRNRAVGGATGLMMFIAAVMNRLRGFLSYTMTSLDNGWSEQPGLRSDFC